MNIVFDKSIFNSTNATVVLIDGIIYADKWVVKESLKNKKAKQIIGGKDEKI